MRLTAAVMVWWWHELKSHEIYINQLLVRKWRRYFMTFRIAFATFLVPFSILPKDVVASQTEWAAFDQTNGARPSYDTEHSHIALEFGIRDPYMAAESIAKSFNSLFTNRNCFFYQPQPNSFIIFTRALRAFAKLLSVVGSDSHWNEDIFGVAGVCYLFSLVTFNRSTQTRSNVLARGRSRPRALRAPSPTCLLLLWLLPS